MVSSREDTLAQLETVLYHTKRSSAMSVTKQVTPGWTDVDLTFDLEDVSLWSPEAPIMN